MSLPKDFVVQEKTLYKTNGVSFYGTNIKYKKINIEQEKNKLIKIFDNILAADKFDNMTDEEVDRQFNKLKAAKSASLEKELDDIEKELEFLANNNPV